MTSHLEKHGQNLIDLGYNIVPIFADTKSPRIKGWQDVIATSEHIPQWVASNHKGCGILSANTVGIDIDCHNPVIAQYMIKFTQDYLGDSPYRIGKEPKALLPFRCDVSFKKKSSQKFTSPDGLEHMLEILADGQQFVAAAIHPDTKKPYVWHYADGTMAETLTVSHSMLPAITAEDADILIEEFERQCVANNWVSTNSAKPNANANQSSAKIHNYSDDDIRDMMKHIDPDPYDAWVKVGMALKNSGFSVDLWDEWSRKSAKYQEGECQIKWMSFFNGGRA